MNGKRGEVWFVEPNRPCVIVQPPEMDRLRTTIVAPLTSHGFAAPFRVPTTFGNSTYVVCDQIRAIDRQRLRRLAGVMEDDELSNVLRTLQTLFAR